MPATLMAFWRKCWWLNCLEQRWADNQMELTIDLQDVKLYTLDRADWWIGGMLSEYKNGPITMTNHALHSTTFFGEDGT